MAWIHSVESGNPELTLLGNLHHAYLNDFKNNTCCLPGLDLAHHSLWHLPCFKSIIKTKTSNMWMSTFRREVKNKVNTEKALITWSFQESMTIFKHEKKRYCMNNTDSACIVWAFCKIGNPTKRLQKYIKCYIHFSYADICKDFNAASCIMLSAYGVTQWFLRTRWEGRGNVKLHFPSVNLCQL